jgi:hypothetical protein
VKKIYATYLLLLIVMATNAQAPSWFWAKSAGGNDWEKALSIASDNSGNLYVTGYFESTTIAFDSDTLNTNGVSMFLVKYDASGNVLWAKDADGFSHANTVTTDNSGNVYVAGFYSSFGGPITFGSFTLTRYGMFIVKYDSSGNVLWARDTPNGFSSAATSVSVDNLGNVFVAGDIGGDTMFIASDTLLHTYYDKFLAKYDTGGNEIWGRGLYTGAVMTDVSAPFLAADKFGNVYITGGIAVNTAIIVSTTLVNQGDHNIYLAKVNGAGSVLWAKRYGNSGHDDGTSVAVDTSGNVYISGYYTDLSITFSPLTLTGGGVGTHVYVVKLDPAGNAIWANKVKGLGSYNPVKIAVDKNHEVYIAGYWGSNSNALVFSATDSLVNKGLFLAKYDMNGNFKWARDAIGGNRATGVAVNDFGNSYIAGYFSADTLIFDAIQLIDTAAPFNIFVAAMNNTTTIAENNINEVNGFSAFPNPSQGSFFIVARQQNESSVCIYDMLGKEISHTVINEGIHRLDLFEHPKGIYLVTLSSGNNKYSKKIIVQ